MVVSGEGEREEMRWETRHYATKEVRVGEVFVERTERTGFPVLGFSRQGSIDAWRGPKTAPAKHFHFGGS
jgi:hypothetical protein